LIDNYILNYLPFFFTTPAHLYFVIIRNRIAVWCINSLKNLFVLIFSCCNYFIGKTLTNYSFFIFLFVKNSIIFWIVSNFLNYITFFFFKKKKFLKNFNRSIIYKYLVHHQFIINFSTSEKFIYYYVNMIYLILIHKNHDQSFIVL
jgi:hypothetical protein